jgi:hypothetical protein
LNTFTAAVVSALDPDHQRSKTMKRDRISAKEMFEVFAIQIANPGFPQESILPLIGYLDDDQLRSVLSRAAAIAREHADGLEIFAVTTWTEDAPSPLLAKQPLSR